MRNPTRGSNLIGKNPRKRLRVRVSLEESLTGKRLPENHRRPNRYLYVRVHLADLKALREPCSRACL
jgi:hypothetical protein